MSKGRPIGYILPRTLAKHVRINELYATGMNAHNIAKEVHMTAQDVGKYLKAKGIKLHPYGRVHSLNENIFSVIDSEEKAYWLGFLFADGSVSYTPEGKNKRYTVELTLAEIDRDHIERFKKFIKSTSSIKKRVVKLKGKEYTAFRINFSSKTMVEDLISLGCVPRKSLVKKFPILPKELESHFIRGYYDGNGTVSPVKGRNTLSIEIVSSFNMVRYLSYKFDITSKYAKHGKAFGLRFYGSKSIQFLEYIYRDATVYLPRKYVKIARYIGNDIMHNPNNG